MDPDRRDAAKRLRLKRQREAFRSFWSHAVFSVRNCTDYHYLINELLGNIITNYKEVLWQTNPKGAHE